MCSDCIHMVVCSKYLAMGDNVKDCEHYLPSTTIVDVDISFYDKVDVYENCTVQILTNTITGDTSVGWWKNE